MIRIENFNLFQDRRKCQNFAGIENIMEAKRENILQLLGSPDLLRNLGDQKKEHK
jgi:hypothetical protein